MIHVITDLAVHPLRIALGALTSALLAALVFMALSPGIALAAVQNNDIRFAIGQAGGTDLGFPQNWTREPPTKFVRTKTTTGDGTIRLFLNDNVDGGVCVRLVNAHKGERLGVTRCWRAGSYGEQILATNVRAPTRFTVWATKRYSTTKSTNNVWGGYHTTSRNPWRGGYLRY